MKNKQGGLMAIESGKMQVTVWIEKETIKAINELARQKKVTKTVIYNTAVKQFISDHYPGLQKREPAYWNEMIPGSLKDMILYHAANYEKDRQDDRQLELF